MTRDFCLWDGVKGRVWYQTGTKTFSDGYPQIPPLDSTKDPLCFLCFFLCTFLSVFPPDGGKGRGATLPTVVIHLTLNNNSRHSVVVLVIRRSTPVGQVRHRSGQDVPQAPGGGRGAVVQSPDLRGSPLRNRGEDNDSSRNLWRGVES